MKTPIFLLFFILVGFITGMEQSNKRIPGYVQETSL